ncbi:MAG: ThiF family adenylyltransferase [Bacteroidota bacterium]
MSTPNESLDLTGINHRTHVLEPLGWPIEKFQSSWVMVVGAGALGNEVLKNLALIGVGNILIIDFDVVERSNLARSVLYRESDCTGDLPKVEIAAQRLKELNPDLNILTVNGDVSIDIGWGIIRRMDAVIGCVDNRLARLYINRMTHRLGKSWVDGGILDLGGQMNVFTPGISCYESQLSPKAWEIIQFRMGCADRAMRYASSGQANTIPITSSIIGAMQVQEALKLIAKPDEVSNMADKQFFYEGLSATYMNLPTSPVKDDCLSRDLVEEIIEAPALSHQSTVKEALTWIQQKLEDPDLVISLDYLLVMELGTGQSDKRIPLVKARPHLTQEEMNQYAQIEGEEVKITQKTSELGPDFPHLEKRLEELGVPPLHILTIYSKGKKRYVELTRDTSFLDT